MSIVNAGAIRATWQRQVGSLMLNPLGYVFILVFVLVSAGILFLPDEYFARNIADFGPLLMYMPWLLVVLLPALAMGSWASERELGTEEQLMTLPMGLGDALFGKWLGVVTYFTLALACSCSNVIVLKWLGTPDLGLIFANYAGWWLAGLVFAALSVLASTLVAMPAIAFVLGVLFCAAAMWGADKLDWFDPFNRGLVPLGKVIFAPVMICMSLGLAGLVLSARCWQQQHMPEIFMQVAVFVFSAVTLFNLSVKADRNAVDWDSSSERLSSLSQASLEVLKQIKEPVTVTAFISAELPPELAEKGKEIENKLKVLDREMGDKVRLDLYRPESTLDEAGTNAKKQFGLEPRSMPVETVAGKEMRDVFLGAVVRCGSKMQTIPYFSPGLSVEYELARTIRSIAETKKKVLGIVENDLKVNGGFDMMRRAPINAWDLVAEFKKQYEVNEVNLDSPVSKDIDVLLAPQISLLSEQQLARLHDYIWEGRPCLILEDPLPIFSGENLGTSQPKNNPEQMPGQPPSGAQKPDLQPLMQALGLAFDGKEIVWSEFNPSHAFRDQFPRTFVWSRKQDGGVADNPVTTGISSLLLLCPGFLKEAPGKSDDITVTPLVTTIPDVPWGYNPFDENFKVAGFFGQRRLITPEKLKPLAGPPGILAAAVSGKMRRAYDFSEKKDDEKDGDKNDKGEKDEAAAKHAPGTGKGLLGEKPVRVVFITDIDFCHDQFFSIYRAEGQEFSQDDLRFLRDLRNVQFVSNAVDALAEDQDFLELRTRLPRARPLSALEEVLKRTQKARTEAETKAREEADRQLQERRETMDKRVEEIDKRKDIDEGAKDQLKESVRITEQRKLEKFIEEVNEQKERADVEAGFVQKKEIDEVRNNLRWLAMGVPSAVLAFMALVVFFFRFASERLVVPENRMRGAS
ncbi:MAG: Gldg family protein [Planctomycetes bacterium]|nr:Gldg family protein [Planctomycetota bacterium]